MEARAAKRAALAGVTPGTYAAEGAILKVRPASMDRLEVSILADVLESSTRVDKVFGYFDVSFGGDVTIADPHCPLSVKVQDGGATLTVVPDGPRSCLPRKISFTRLTASRVQGDYACISRMNEKATLTLSNAGSSGATIVTREDGGKVRTFAARFTLPMGELTADETSKEPDADDRTTTNHAFAFIRERELRWEYPHFDYTCTR